MKRILAWALCLATFAVVVVWAAVGNRPPNTQARLVKFEDIENFFDGPGDDTHFIMGRPSMGFGFTVWKENAGVQDSLKVVLQGAPIKDDSTAWKTIYSFGPTSGYFVLADTGAVDAQSYWYNGETEAVDTLRLLHRYFRIILDHRGASTAAPDTATQDTCRVFIQMHSWGDKLNH